MKILFKTIIWFKNYIKQHAIRFLLRTKGIKLGNSVYIKGKCQISRGVEIGSLSIIQDSILDGRGILKIGSHCIINGATILTAEHNLDSYQYETTYAPVLIEDYVIIYGDSIILPGRKIGLGSVVAAGAVVTKDVPQMTIVAGNPARVIRVRENIHKNCDIKSIAGDVFQKRLREMIKKTVLHKSDLKINN